ncbi:MAG: DPP IV N-terminal domain-containing protein [Calditrichia bacterium]
MMQSVFKWVILLCGMTAFYRPVTAQQENLTIEWIYDGSRREATAIPDYFWRADGRVIFYNRQHDHQFELYNPQNNSYEDFLQEQNALQSLKELTGKSRTYLSWPAGFSTDGKRALYLYQNDIFLLDVSQAGFRRLTHTQEKETVPRFSPDGEKVAFVRENDLFIYDLKNDREERLTHSGSETILNGTLSYVYYEEVFNRKNISYWWSGDSRAIAFFQFDESQVPLMHFVGIEPQTPRVIKQRYPKAGQPNPQVRLGIVQLDGQEVTWAKIDTAKYEYLVRVNWLPDNRRVAVETLNRLQTDLNLYFVDRRSGGAEKILSEHNEGWVRLHDDLNFLKKQSAFLWISERSGYAHLYLYDMNGNLLRQLTGGKWSLRASGASGHRLDATVIAIDETEGVVYFTGQKDSPLQRNLYRIGLDGQHLQRISEQPGTHKIHFSPDNYFYLDTWSSHNHPPELKLYRKNGRLLDTVAESGLQTMKELGLQYREYFTIPAPDGFELPASILKPADFDSTRKYPVILNVYGGPSSPQVKDTWNYYIFFDNILLREGFLVVRVDNRSSAGISKKYENMVAGRMMGDLELNDLKSAADWLAGQAYIDSSRIGIWGWSGGGTYTLLGMTGSDAFKAGVAIAPVTDWHFYDTKYTEFGMRTPQANPAGYEATSLVNAAGNLHGRLLLIHGTADDNVHIQNSWAFANQLIQHNILFEMMIYPMRKHGISDSAARIHLFNTILDFWKRNL